VREPADPEALLRSRYAAYGLGLVDYLWRTLHPEHEDRAHPRDAVLRELRLSARSYRYTGLTVLERRAQDAEGIARVLFLARVFERGQDRSFVEVSHFAHDGVGWRYLSGVTRPIKQLNADPATLTIAALEP
jgi:SEC-C motif-containing protein